MAHSNTAMQAFFNQLPTLSGYTVTGRGNEPRRFESGLSTVAADPNTGALFFELRSGPIEFIGGVLIGRRFELVGVRRETFEPVLLSSVFAGQKPLINLYREWYQSFVA